MNQETEIITPSKIRILTAMGAYNYQLPTTTTKKKSDMKWFSKTKNKYKKCSSGREMTKGSETVWGEREGASWLATS